MSTLEQVQEHLQKSGPLKASQLSGQISESLVLSSLLNVKRMETSSGCVPFSGGRWQHISGGQRVELYTQDTPSISAAPFETLNKRRLEMLCDFLVAVEQEFKKHTSNDDPAKWVLVVLEGEWLKETPVPNGNEVSLYLDGSFAFKPVSS